jgi:hypothetical protein
MKSDVKQEEACVGQAVFQADWAGLGFARDFV